MANYVYSTLTNGQVYKNYTRTPEGVQIETGSVAIKGGANLTDKTLFTPYGACTEVTDQELEVLRSNPVFILHQKNGFVRIDVKPMNVSEIVDDLELKDGSAPTTPEDYENSEAKVKKKTKKA